MSLRCRFAFLFLLVALLATFALPAQAQFTTITATNIQNGDGLPLALGTTCWLGVNNSGQAIGYRAGGSGQVTTTPVCRDIVNGAVQTTYKGTTIGTLKVADTTLTTPVNVCYKVTVVDSSSGKVVLGSYAGAKSGYDCVQPSGTTWSFDTYTPAATPGVVQVAGPVGPTGPQGPAGVGVSAASDITFSGTDKFTGTFLDDTSTVLRPAEFTGADLCAKISAAFAWAIAQGWTSATVDARQRQWLGAQTCSGSPFAAVSNNGTFTGLLLTQGVQLLINPASLPVVQPGGIWWDGSGPRSLPNPTRNFAGTSIQPSGAYSGGAVLQLGAKTDPSSPQAVRFSNLAISCLPPGATYTNGAGTTGVVNMAGQEMSGGEYFIVNACQTGLDVEQSTGFAWASSGFDSSGFAHGAILTPNDPAAIGIMYGGSSLGVAGLSHVYGFRDITVTGTPSGVSPGAANGTGIDIEGSDTAVDGIRLAYLNKGVVVGAINTAVNVRVENITMTSNTNNAWTQLVDLEAGAGYLVTVRNALGVGPGVAGAAVLHDANYPGAACDLLSSSEAGIGFYTRGIGGGANGNVVSTARTACTTTGIFASLFSASNTWTGTNNNFNNVQVGPNGTATSGANFPSFNAKICNSVWNGTAPTTACGSIASTAGSGTNPSFNYKFNSVAGAASTNLDLSPLSANGVTFPPQTFKTNSTANTVQNGLNLNSGTGITVTNTSNANVSIGLSGPVSTANGGTGQASLADGANIKHKRVTSCTTAASANATCTTTVTWSTAFADAAYTPGCMAEGVSGAAYVVNVTSKLAASMVVTIQNMPGSAVASQVFLDCKAIHD